MPTNPPMSRYLDRTLSVSRNPRGSEIRILVPIVRAQAAHTLIAVGDALAKPRDADGKVLGLVEVPRNNEQNLAPLVTSRRRDLLKWIAERETAATASGRLGILVRVAYNVPLSIREAVYETGTNLLVVEWPGPESQRAGILTSVLDDLTASPPADLVLVRPPLRSPEPAPHRLRIVVPIRGGLNARLALRVATSLAQAWGGELALVHLVNPDHHPDRRAHELAQARDAARNAPAATLVEREATDVAQAILDMAADADVVVLGAYSERDHHPALVRPEIAGALSRFEGLLILVRSARLEAPAAAAGGPNQAAAADP